MMVACMWWSRSKLSEFKAVSGWRIAVALGDGGLWWLNSALPSGGRGNPWRSDLGQGRWSLEEAGSRWLP